MPFSATNHGIIFNGLLPSCSYKPADFLNEDDSPLLFPRGFLICKQSDLKISPHFSRRILRDGESKFFLYTHKLLNLEFGHADNVRVTILGTAYLCNKITSDNVSQKLAEVFAEQGRDEFLNTLDFIGGRYVVILETDNQMELFPDACAMKSVFYSPSAKAIGSHLDLVNMVANADLSEVEKHFRDKGYTYFYTFVGNYTTYEGIFLLIPNFKLSLDDFSTERFYPRHKITRGKDLYEVKQEFFKACQNEFQNIKTNFNMDIVFSLSAGKDSRVSFYATQDLNHDCVYITEDRDDDIDGARSVAKFWNLNWIGSDIKSIKHQSNQYYKAFQKIVLNKIFPRNAAFKVMLNHFWNLNIFPKQMIHIHSNCAEVGRGRYYDDQMYSFPYPANTYSFEKFLEAYIYSTTFIVTDEIKNKQTAMMDSDKKLINWLKEYFDKLNLGKLTEWNYNPWDFVYNEQRCAQFLSMTHQPSDAIFESISLTNCRRILEILWQVPDEFVNDSSLLYTCILNEHDPTDKKIHMGVNFKPSARDYDNYALIYGGYLFADKITAAKKAIDINPTVKWAQDILK